MKVRNAKIRTSTSEATAKLFYTDQQFSKIFEHVGSLFLKFQYVV